MVPPFPPSPSSALAATPSPSSAPAPAVRPWPWSHLLPALVALAVLGPAWLLSDNLHSRIESTSFDRLMLGLRWLQPDGSRWDPHFPLGTAVVMAIPHALGLDPVVFGRGLSLLCALLGGGLLMRLVARAGGARAAALCGVGLCLVPALVRGAVVTGEEAPYLLAVVACLWGLVSAAGTGTSRTLARRPLGFPLLAVLAANAAVLVRLDAMTLLPGLALVAFALLGSRRGALFVLGSGVTALVHLAASWRIHGDPFSFARVSSMNIQRNADGFTLLGPALLPRNVAGELGGLPLLAGWAGLALAGWGAVTLVRRSAGAGGWAPGAVARVGQRARDPAGLALLITAFWLLAMDTGLSMVGAMEARTMRYLVPLLALLVALGALAAVDPDPRGKRWRRAVSGLAAGGLLLNLPVIARQVRDERLPEGLAEIARELGARVRSAAGGPGLPSVGGDAEGSGSAGERVLVAEEHPTLVVLSGLDWRLVDVLPAGSPDGNDAQRVREAWERTGARWFVTVAGNPPPDALPGPPWFEVARSPCCGIYRRP